MKLLTDELRAKLPRLYSQESEADPIVYARFFLPGTGRNPGKCDRERERFLSAEASVLPKVTKAKTSHPL